MGQSPFLLQDMERRLMNREEAKEYVKNNLREYVERITDAGSQKGFYVCPFCRSGTGTNHTAAFSINRDGQHYKCFACGEYGDIFDLISKIENIPINSAQLFQKAYDLFSVDIDEESNFSKPKNEKEKRLTKGKKNYSQYLKKCKTNVYKTQYFLERGLSWETVDDYDLGYDVEKKQIIIPYDKSMTYYIGRNTYKDKQKRGYFKPKSEEAGEEPLYNGNALYGDGSYVFVVEGQLDALSLIEIGEKSVIGLNSSQNIQKLVNQLKNRPVDKTLILALDNDEAGHNATKKLVQELEQMNILYLCSEICGKYKDPNEALCKERDNFIADINRAIENSSDVESYTNQLNEKNRQEYINTASALVALRDFVDGIKGKAYIPPVPTGYKNLDMALDDGLYEGLYVIGAISSLGKPTFVLQMCDQIAASGKDVLIFSLEMSKAELVAKSISRLSYINNPKHAKSTRGITSCKKIQMYSQEDRENINKSVSSYGKFANHIYISEGMGNITTDKIRETVETHIRVTGNQPIVVVDYLQIIAPLDVRMNDKQNIDRAVFELKRLSRTYKIPVIAISSLNRGSYTSDICMAAFKESGAIEYSSDVLIGLQLEIQKDKDKKDSPEITESEQLKAKNKDVRKITLKILKNRNGRTGDIVKYDYRPMFNFFQESELKPRNTYVENNKVR